MKRTLVVLLACVAAVGFVPSVMAAGNMDYRRLTAPLELKCTAKSAQSRS